MLERGASEEEVAATVDEGERFAAKFADKDFVAISHSTRCGEIGYTI
jgi:hypothetical protein